MSGIKYNVPLYGEETVYYSGSVEVFATSPKEALLKVQAMLANNLLSLCGMNKTGSDLVELVINGDEDDIDELLDE